MKNENIAIIDRIDSYLRREDTLLAKSLIYICPLTGEEYRQSTTKRLAEGLIVVPTVLISLPLFGAIAYLIKREDNGPVFYKQKRRLRLNTDFYLYKFRSMRENAEREINPLFHVYSRSEKGEDPRCTKIGSFIRNYDFDEIPQLLQILRGEMSLIGFRAQPDYSFKNIESKYPALFEKWRDSYFQGKPAILNLLSVAGHCKTYSDKDKLHFDLLYARKASLGLDLYIVWRHFNNALLAVFNNSSLSVAGKK